MLTKKREDQDRYDFNLEDRIIAGQKVKVKVYQSKFDKYNKGPRNLVYPKTKSGGKV